MVTLSVRRQWCFRWTFVKIRVMYSLNELRRRRVTNDSKVVALTTLFMFFHFGTSSENSFVRFEDSDAFAESGALANVATRSSRISSSSLLPTFRMMQKDPQPHWFEFVVAVPFWPRIRLLRYLQAVRNLDWLSWISTAPPCAYWNKRFNCYSPVISASIAIPVSI